MATRRRASKSTLTGNITDLQRRVRYLQAKPVPGRLANQVVTRSTIQPRAVSTDQIALAAITNDQVAADAIRQEQLANLSVGNPELQDNSVLNRNIARDAVNAESIEINAVGSSEIADNAVGSGEIADNAVGSSEIADSAVGSSEIATDAVGQSEIAPNSVGTSELIDLAVTSAKLDNDAVVEGKIAPDTVAKDRMKQNSVGAREIINGSITAAQLSSDPRAVTSEKIADSAVITNRINNLAVTTAKIAGLAVTTEKIAEDAVTQAKLANNSVGGPQIILGAVGTSSINERAYGPIVQRGISSGTGITGNFQEQTGRYNIAVEFGGGSGQVARGNHIHTSGLIDTGPPKSPSTIKVKQNISTHKLENVKNLLNLEPKRYKYKRSHRKYQDSVNTEWMYGYLAEDLIELGFLEPVGYDKEGAPATLDYGLMSLLVLELVKAQQTEIDSLKEEIQEIKGQL